MASFGFMVIRGLFGLAEHIAPLATGRLAFAMFSRTPSSNRMSERERGLMAQSQALFSEARRHCLTTGDARVAAYDFARHSGGRAGAPTVLLVHGWGSRARHLAGWIEALVAQGFRVIALDLPGHGESSGRRLDMARAVRAVAVADQWFGPFAAVVGHSFGGAVAANAAVGSIRGAAPVRTGRLIMVSAPSSMPALFGDFGKFLSLGARTQTALAERVTAIAGRPLSDFVVAEQLTGKSVPTLVIHAPDDREVSPREAEAIAAAGAHVSLDWAPGLGHRRILSDAAVSRRIAAFACGEG